MLNDETLFDSQVLKRRMVFTTWIVSALLSCHAGGMPNQRNGICMLRIKFSIGSIHRTKYFLSKLKARFS